MKIVTNTTAVLSLALGITAPTTASITGASFVYYSVSVEDFGGGMVEANVVDLYVTSNDASDVLLNVYNFRIKDGACGAADPGIAFFQSLTGTGWLPANLGDDFDTEALQKADSFVTIGGISFSTPLQVPGAGAGTGLDPNFGGNTAAYPQSDGGWYNGNPPSLMGQVGDTAAGLGVLVARFASTSEFDLPIGGFEITWNQGLGTPGQQAAVGLWGCPACCDLRGDLVPDTRVDAADLGHLLSAFGSDCVSADLDEDGVVGASDIGLLLSLWGNDCFAFEREAVDGPSQAALVALAVRTADLNADGCVNDADLQNWRHARNAGNVAADLNGDGRTDGADLGILLASWREQPKTPGAEIHAIEGPANQHSIQHEGPREAPLAKGASPT